jgi:DNA end-binding protein Ku
MARAIWTGALNFGLVTIPVGLYSATEDHTTHFHQLQRGTTDRVRIRRVNERTGEEVPFDQIVKGYDLGEQQYVVIEPGELDEIAPGRSRVIDVSAFVDLDAVDPVYFTNAYYLGPRGKEFAQSYSLLLQALEDSRKAAIATFVMRGKEYLTAIRPNGLVLEMHTLHYADEIRDPVQELPGLPERTDVSAGHLAAARQLIDMLSADWNPEEYRDTFEDRIHELIDAKRSGEQVVAAEGAPEATNVIDLMEALQRSLDQAAGRGGEGRAEEKAEGGKKAKGGGGKRASGEATVTPIAEDLSELTKAELYERATEQGLPGRSKMSREELLKALTAAARPRRARGRKHSVA